MRVRRYSYVGAAAALLSIGLLPAPAAPKVPAPIVQSGTSIYQFPLNDGNDVAVSSLGSSVGTFLAAGACDGEVFRTLIEFPKSRFDILPANALIIKAELQLNVTAGCNQNTASYAAFPLLERFDESTVTWASQPLADLSSPSGTTLLGPTDLGLRTFDITGLFQVWRSNPSSDFGLQLRQLDESFEAAILAESSEASSSALWPTIILFVIDCDPIAALLALRDMVYALNVKHGILNSMDAKIDAVMNALTSKAGSNNNAALGALDGFINATSGQSGNQIPVTDAVNLIAQAEIVKQQILCSP